jgi:uncharacterized protein YecE (DUF72 family)
MRSDPSNRRPSPLLRIGTASWSLPKGICDAPASASRLERYASLFDCVEINSSFYRPHRRSTYERWAASTPANFSFSVKAPKRISHEQRLMGCGDALDEFGDEIEGLGQKLGVVLLQLPPSLAFAPAQEEFLAVFRRRFSVPLVCEPRHRSWFAAEASRLLDTYGISRAATDPAVVPAAAKPHAAGGVA